MTIDSLAKAGYVGFGAGGAGGLWLFVHEMSYASAHPGTELAGVLQVTGLAIAAVAGGGVGAMAMLRRLTTRAGSHDLDKTSSR